MTPTAVSFESLSRLITIHHSWDLAGIKCDRCQDLSLDAKILILNYGWYLRATGLAGEMLV